MGTIVHGSVFAAQSLARLVEALMELGRVAAPARSGDVVDYRLISDPAEALFDDRIAYKSPKEFAFPQSEEIMRLSDSGAEPVVPEGTTVVFGVRPCDLEGLRVMEAVFSGGRYEDPFFAERRKRLVVVGLGCVAKKPGCFCDERGVDLSDSPYCDLFASPVEGGFEIGARSPRGDELLAAIGPRIGAPIASGAPTAQKAPPAPKALDGTRDGPAAAGSRAGGPSPAILALPDAEDAAVFGLKVWDEAAMACIGCGTCSFLCPTCHCFVFKDVDEGGVTRRYRQWDCCMFPNFTAHASGHNPRATKKERFRQRVMHKYLYVPKNVGLVACSGCGRCVRSCPGGVSIRDAVIAAAAELAAAASSSAFGPSAPTTPTPTATAPTATAPIAAAKASAAGPGSAPGKDAR